MELTVYSAVLAFFLAFIIAFGRLSKVLLLRGLSKIYVEILRGTSLLVQLFWAFFVLPFFGINLSPMVAGVLVLGLNLSAYASEVVRSSILAIPKAQTEAGIALNMTPIQIMRHVILPQAFLRMLPPFGNLLIELLKGTALVSLITLNDLMFQGSLLRVATHRSNEIFSLILIMYFLLAYPITLAVRRFEKRFSEGRI